MQGGNLLPFTSLHDIADPSRPGHEGFPAPAPNPDRSVAQHTVEIHAEPSLGASQGTARYFRL